LISTTARHQGSHRKKAASVAKMEYRKGSMSDIVFRLRDPGTE
jgi:hypothetical protein